MKAHRHIGSAFARSSIVAVGALALAAGACGKDEGGGDGPGLAITVKPLQLNGIAEVVYGITVKRNGGQVVWAKTDLASTQFGDGAGGLAYVGPCDGSEGSNPHTVELVIQSITEVGGQPASFQNPAPEGSPVVVTANCQPNRDMPVVFNLTVMREANQGFFDIAVNFSDIFCSAKFDCVDAQGGDMDLLHNPTTGQRDQTVVMGFACTSGAAQQAGGTSQTWLHLTDVHVECTEPETVPPVVTSYTIDPSIGEGNIGEVNPIFFQVGDYRDQEELTPYDKCFWNMAFGVNEGIDAANCTLVAQGTASDESWDRADDAEQGDGWSPADTVYPYIEWRIPLTDATGNVSCGQHPMNGADGRVSTKYTPMSGAKFTHEWQCGSDVITTEKVSCSANVTGIGGSSVSFTQTPDGVTVAFGAAPGSQTYKLPAGYGEITDCCLNPCCTDATPPPQ